MKLHSQTKPWAGFTLVELMLVAGLMSFLVLLISGAWTGFGRSMTDSIVRCQVAQEANLALASLAMDFHGNLPEDVTGALSEGEMVGRLVVGGSQLSLCFDGGSPANGSADWSSPDTVISYDVQSNQLVRTNQQTGTATIVARHVNDLMITDQADGVAIDLTFEYRDLTRTYTIVTQDP